MKSLLKYEKVIDNYIKNNYTKYKLYNLCQLKKSYNSYFYSKFILKKFKKNRILYLRRYVLIKLSYENSNMLKDIFRYKKNLPMISDLVSNILNIKIKDIEFKEIIEFKTISEYKFSVVKTSCDIGMKDKVDVYLKIIKNNKIKESLFCYWCLLYEEKVKKSKNMTSIQNKVTISEVGMEKFKNSIFLKIENNTSKVLENGVKVYFVDFLKYINNYKGDNNSLGKWNKYIDKDSNDVLMIGVILNKDMKIKNKIV